MSANANGTPNLSARKIVIAGGTGSVGEGIVRAWLRSGAEVIVPTRSQTRSDEFRKIIGAEGDAGRLSLIVGDYTSFDGATALADRIEQTHGRVTDVAAAIGKWWTGQSIWSTDQSAWDEVFTGYATAHLAMARAWLPRIDAQGSYHIIVGASAIYPIKGSGIVSMQQAALLMMGKVIQTEAADSRRVFTSLLGPVNNRNRARPQPDWISAEDVGLLTATVAADTSVGSENFTLLDQAAFQDALDGVGRAGKQS